jgi:hypothetical protein
MCISTGKQWGESFWSSISDQEAEEIAARHCGHSVYLIERRVRPNERGTVFYFGKGQRPPPSVPSSPNPAPAQAKPKPPPSPTWEYTTSYNSFLDLQKKNYEM